MPIVCSWVVYLHQTILSPYASIFSCSCCKMWFAFDRLTTSLACLGLSYLEKCSISQIFARKGLSRFNCLITPLSGPRFTSKKVETQTQFGFVLRPPQQGFIGGRVWFTLQKAFTSVVFNTKTNWMYLSDESVNPQRSNCMYNFAQVWNADRLFKQCLFE